jgi:hypothetical protein
MSASFARSSSVTSWKPPARSATVRFRSVNAPDPTWYRRVSAEVRMVSQPPTVLAVNGVRANPSRPTALKVAASTNALSPAYSVRMSVGERTSKRAWPEITAERAAPPGAAAAAPPGTAAATRVVAVSAQAVRIATPRWRLGRGGAIDDSSVRSHGSGRSPGSEVMIDVAQ